MPDGFRRFRQHPIYSTIGGLFAMLLIGMTSVVWLGALSAMVRGHPLLHNAWIALTAVSVYGGWYINFMSVCHRLRRLDPRTYAWATKDMGYIAYVFSSRSSPAHLHNALAGLDLDPYPATFRYHVRFTLLLNATLLWAFCVAAVGMLIVSIVTKHR
ncbi:MAG TPA: hypothetical protein VFA43_21955 [Gemmatimonadaceae bacterium]|nr:hypothetical protein [Gemmatimonadaceae bacterium]